MCGPMILVAGATEGARLRLPLSAVACVVRSPASAPTGEEVLKTCWLDLECDWLEGAACEHEDSLRAQITEAEQRLDAELSDLLGELAPAPAPPPAAPAEAAAAPPALDEAADEAKKRAAEDKKAAEEAAAEE